MVLILLLVSFGSNAQAMDERAAKIDALFQEYNRPNVPGASVIVIKDGKVLFKRAYGMADLEYKVPSTTSTNYRIASLTKQFTAMAIMILAERGKLSYDDHLTDLFPDFPQYGKTITIRNLLNHTSGLIEYGEVMPKDRTEPLSDRDVLDLMKQQDHTYFTPGSQFRYSNTGYTLLALIVEKASGVPFAEFLKKNVFRPLRMNHTTFYRRDDHTDRHRAYGYTKQGDTFAKTDQSLTSSILGDGSIYSSIDDLYNWDQALSINLLVSAKTLKQAFTPGASVDQSTGYGFGWFIENKRGMSLLWHGGNTIGFTGAIQRFPEQRFTVIVLANRNGAQLSEIVDKIEDLYLFNSK
jgi:CubicO group peptidase (beta-lactamase class C family)